MKKLLIFLSCVVVVAALADIIIVPGSQFQIRHGIKGTDRIIFIDTNFDGLSDGFISNYTASYSDFVQTLTTNQTFLNSLMTNQAFLSNLVYNVTNASFNTLVADINPTILNSYVLAPFATGSPSNTYYPDFGQTNALGQIFIYADCTSGNDFYMAGVTNCKLDSLLSFDVFYPVGGLFEFPTNLFLATNGSFLVFTNDGFGVTNQRFEMVIPAGDLLRNTIRSNRNGLEFQFELKP